MLANYARWYTFLPPQWSTIPPPLTLVITFVDDSQPGDRWLGQFTLNLPDARFASELVKAMPLWCPRQPGVGFSKSMQ